MPRALSSSTCVFNGMLILLQVGNLARAAMLAADQDASKCSRFAGALTLIGVEFDKLWLRYGALHVRIGGVIRSC